jgi:peptidoglycan/LPS O-acetylase OafA/YrhL
MRADVFALASRRPITRRIVDARASSWITFANFSILGCAFSAPHAVYVRMRPRLISTALFRRVVSGSAFVPELDGLRAVAILAVVAFHTSGYFLVKNLERGAYAAPGQFLEQAIYWILTHGFLGVQLFFVISGLVISLPFVRQARGHGGELRMRDYFVRRVTRIEPPYLLALCIYFVIAWRLSPATLNPTEYLAGALYARHALFHEQNWMFYVSWSLEIEIQFYLLAPLFALVFRAPSALLRRGLLIAAIVASGYYAAHFRMQSSEPPPLGGPLQHGWWLGTELAFFLVGMLVADLSVREAGSRPVHAPPRRAAYAWDIGFLAGLAAALCSYQVLQHSVAGIFLLLTGLFLVTLGTSRSCLVRATLSHPAAYTIGGACYTIYLFHPLLTPVVGRILLPATGSSYVFDMIVIALPAALGISLACLLLFPIVERPFMYRGWPSLVADAFRRREIRAIGRLFNTCDSPRDTARASHTSRHIEPFAGKTLRQ